MSAGSKATNGRIHLADLRFDERGLVPAIARDARTGEVLMLAWQDRAALELTLRERVAWFWSRSRQALWKKGESSGVVLRVVDLRVDCDGDAVLLDVEAEGPACHLGRRSCFEERLAEDAEAERRYFSLGVLERHLRARAAVGDGSSYTQRLLSGPEDELYRKIGEEATEVLLAAKGGERAQLVEEAADLVYHLIVTLMRRGASFDDVQAVLARRSGR
ncbi:MAG: bifunctional phosphoribosyl-AMP cyclohydrolase/phosphoribosyl-ATP diphosphatase HisIE [Planctomycetes bacterium]|nr:bifunctional phosphoribosyl-AMP cyclohydrolase/phosphoribosyl-ATP diphosphatase HisIE [Planctomycetota bacterium]